MNIRKVRLTDEIRDLVGTCFQGGQLDDPRLHQVTVTGVKLSPDLQVASIYFRVYSDMNLDEILLGLRSATGFFKRKLARNLKIRRVPDLRYFYDKSVEQGSKIEQLIRQLHA